MGSRSWYPFAEASGKREDLALPMSELTSNRKGQFALPKGEQLIGEAVVNKVIFGDNLPILADMETSSIDLVYVDPPFNTGKRQQRNRIKSVHDSDGGDRTGFGGRRYRTKHVGSSGYDDYFEDYMSFLEPRFQEASRVLKPNGSFFLHIDYREVHYCKVLLDSIFGRESFINEIIWAYDFGGRSKTKWPTKHDNILWYAKDPSNYTFRYDDMERIPYMAPGLVGKAKAARGKTPTDVWWHTIVHTNGEEKTGYATQKPLGVVDRIVSVHSKPSDTLLDFFAGSGTLGEAAARKGRHFILIDNNPEAIRVMAKRLREFQPQFVHCEGLIPDQHSISSSSSEGTARPTP